jgi:hypothetical protein
MIHGIYIRNRPKDKWHLFSIAASAEKAAGELDVAMKHAKKEEHEHPEVGIQIFESAFYIPEFLKEVRRQTPVYN